MHTSIDHSETLTHVTVYSSTGTALLDMFDDGLRLVRPKIATTHALTDFFFLTAE